MLNSGIDKIKLNLNPIFLNSNIPRHIRADNSLTLHKAGNYTLLSIHAEYFIPFIDYKLQIAKAIHELIEKKIIRFENDYPVFTFMFIFQNLEYFVGVSQVEFFCDFPKGKVSINPIALTNKDIIQYRDNKGILHETFYSIDFESGKSIFCVYNKFLKHIHDRHISHKKIAEMNVEYRIEARLTRDNCTYLDLANLTGTYEDIFKRFKPLLAVMYYKYLYGCVEVVGKSNTYFQRLMREVQKEKLKYFNGNRLRKSESIEYIFENDIEKQLRYTELMEKYYQDMNNEKTTILTSMNDIEMMDLEGS